MRQYDYLHEVETVGFHAGNPRSLVDLFRLLSSLGFTKHDDIVSLDRTGLIPAWQHSAIAEVEVTRCGEEVYGFDAGEWDAFELKYMFASLPFAEVATFLRVVGELALRLSITPTYRGRPIGLDDLRRELAKASDEVRDATGEEPGSEVLAIIIHDTYPRRQT